MKFFFFLPFFFYFTLPFLFDIFYLILFEFYFGMKDYFRRERFFERVKIKKRKGKENDLENERFFFFFRGILKR